MQTNKQLTVTSKEVLNRNTQRGNKLLKDTFTFTIKNINLRFYSTVELIPYNGSESETNVKNKVSVDCCSRYAINSTIVLM